MENDLLFDRWIKKNGDVPKGYHLVAKWEKDGIYFTASESSVSCEKYIDPKDIELKINIDEVIYTHLPGDKFVTRKHSNYTGLLNKCNVKHLKRAVKELEIFIERLEEI